MKKNTRYRKIVIMRRQNAKKRQRQKLFPDRFAGTIFENIIALNDSEYDFVEVEKLVQKLEMNDIFANHSYGIHSKLSENASNLSGGQRQKLSLLRALIKKPKVLVLDEATSNLDLNSEKKVIDYLLSLKDTTVIFISHKKYLNDRFDKVYEFNNGKLIEQGVIVKQTSLNST